MLVTLHGITVTSSEGGEDYVPFMMEFVLSAGEDQQCFAIIIKEDNTAEQDEYFRVYIADLLISTSVIILDDG